jgi:hypothetical protein
MDATTYPATSESSAAVAAADMPTGVSWPAVAAGAVATAALTLLLVAFGAGIGLSSVSPWSDTGVSASTFEVGTGIYLVIVGVMSSAVGGYLAGRLRTKWVGVHSSEVFFRDTAHGFLAWAFATLLSATILTASTAYLANGTAAGTGTFARSANPAELYVDKLFRPAPGVPVAARPSSEPNATNPANQTRSEILHLWTADFARNQDLDPSGASSGEAHRQFICRVCHSPNGAHGGRPVAHTTANRPSTTISASQPATGVRITPSPMARRRTSPQPQ